MSKEPNLLFPGKPNYKGPTKGWFSLLHHAAELVEWSDNVMERIEYIKTFKLKGEIGTRLRHIVYLCLDKLDDPYVNYKAKRDALTADYRARSTLLDDDYWDKIDIMYADYLANYTSRAAIVIKYIEPLIKDFAWNGKKLVFPKDGAR